MTKLILTILACAITINMAISQNTTQATDNLSDNKKEEVMYKHSIGVSPLMLYNFSEESADFVSITYAFQATQKDRVSAEFRSWKYAEPMGTYGNSEEFYPGFIRCIGVGTGYQRLIWKGLFVTGQATSFFKQYYDENDVKTQTGYQLYLESGLGYHFEFFKKRMFIEGAWLIKYWPIDTNIPDDFAAVAEGTPKTIWEPSVNIGFKF